MKTTYVFHNGEVVPKSYADAAQTHYVISDTMDGMRHPITGEIMDSKSRFREVTRAHGCTEVGNDKFPERREYENDRPHADLKRLVDQVAPMSRSEFNDFVRSLGNDD